MYVFKYVSHNEQSFSVRYNSFTRLWTAKTIIKLIDNKTDFPIVRQIIY